MRVLSVVNTAHECGQDEVFGMGHDAIGAKKQDAIGTRFVNRQMRVKIPKRHRHLVKGTFEPGLDCAVNIACSDVLNTVMVGRAFCRCWGRLQANPCT